MSDSYFKKIYEEWILRLEADSAIGHLGSQGTARDNIPGSYRSRGQAQSGINNLNTFISRNANLPSPMSGRARGPKMYKPRKPPSIKTKSGSIWKVLSNE